MRNLILALSLISILTLEASAKSDTVAHCSLGKVASTADNHLKKSECLQYCLNAFSETEAEYETDGTVTKSVCQWNNRDVLILGGFTNEGSPTSPGEEKQKLNDSKSAPRSIASVQPPKSGLTLPKEKKEIPNSMAADTYAPAVTRKKSKPTVSSKKPKIIEKVIKGETKILTNPNDSLPAEFTNAAPPDPNNVPKDEDFLPK
ncbi:MAG: hypothetical protein ACK5WZ_04280 [Pseudobdellovibrionaceae bacterium]